MHNAPMSARSPVAARAIAATLLVLAAISAGAAPVDVDLPRQPLADSIKTLARKANVTIAFERSMLAGRISPPVKGRLEARIALEKLLVGSGLTIVSEPDSWMLVREAPPVSPEAPVAPRNYWQDEKPRPGN